MSTIDRELLAQRMADLAVDVAAVVPFVDAFGDRLAGVVRRILTDFGRRDLLGDDDVGGLVWDVALVIAARAGSWRPDAALPWSWAFAAVRSEVARSIGHAGADVDTELLDAEVAAGGRAAPPVLGTVREVDLAELARRHPDVALLTEALDELGISDLHRRVHVEYRIQSSLGDPSPAHTVGDELGLSPANVRQIDRRVRQKLVRVIEAEPRYGSLDGIPWVTARPVGSSEPEQDAA